MNNYVEICATRAWCGKELDLKPTLPRAREIEALAWSTTTGWSDAPLPGLPALLRWIAGAVFPARQSEAGAVARHRESGAE
jgi:hypothetical protein